MICINMYDVYHNSIFNCLSMETIAQIDAYASRVSLYCDFAITNFQVIMIVTWIMNISFEETSEF